MTHGLLILSTIFSCITSTLGWADHGVGGRAGADGTFASLKQKLNKLSCGNSTDAPIWTVIQDPNTNSDKLRADIERKLLPAANGIADRLEQLQKEGTLPENISITIQFENFVNEKHKIQSEFQGGVGTVNIFSDYPPSLQELRNFFKSLPTDFPRQKKLSDEALKTKKLQCEVVLSMGILGGMSADGAINQDFALQQKILTVLNGLAKEGYQVKAETQYLLLNNSVKTAGYSGGTKTTLLINPNSSAAELKPFFEKTKPGANRTLPKKK